MTGELEAEPKASIPDECAACSSPPCVTHGVPLLFSMPSCGIAPVCICAMCSWRAPLDLAQAIHQKSREALERRARVTWIRIDPDVTVRNRLRLGATIVLGSGAELTLRNVPVSFDAGQSFEAAVRDHSHLDVFEILELAGLGACR